MILIPGKKRQTRQRDAPKSDDPLPQVVKTTTSHARVPGSNSDGVFLVIPDFDVGLRVFSYVKIR